MNEGTWYRSGTISLVAGSDLVTGVGTEFVANVLVGGILFTPDGLYEVGQVVSDTTLKIVGAYEGASVGGAGFEVAPTQGAVVAATKQLQVLISAFGPLKDDYESGELNGKGLALKGVKDTEADLPSTGNLQGDGWLVDQTLWVWTGTGWHNSGALVTTPELEQLKTDAESAAISANTARLLAELTTVEFRDQVYPNVYTTPPTQKPSGAPCAEGDSCMILTDLGSGPVPVEYRRSGGQWVIQNVDGAALGGAGGSDIVKFRTSSIATAIRSVGDKLRDSFSVKDAGAKGDGVNDDTVAIELAHFWSPHVRYPRGTYLYNGDGIPAPGTFNYGGAGKKYTTIKLGAGKRWIKSDVIWNGSEIRGFAFEGGAGAILNTATGGLGASRRKIIHDCEFKAYTVCAVDTQHNDCPYWDVQGNTFDGADSISTIGLALGRNSDVSIIKGNAFIRNKVHLKLNKPGLIPDLSGNDFLQFDTGTRRISIWILGNNTSRNYLYIHRNKFGNENLSTTDFRVAVVPELAGATNGSRLPDFDTLVMDGVHTIDFRENDVNGAAGNGPLIYSVSNDLRGTFVGGNTFGGTVPSSLVHYANPTFVDNPYENILFAENYSESGVTVAPVQPCNLGYYGDVVDSRHVVEGDPRYPNSSLSSNLARAGYTELLTTRIGAFGLANATKIANITDAAGGTDAAEFAVTASSEIYATWSTPPRQGEIAWLEFDLMQGGSPATTQIDARIYSTASTSPDYWRKPVKVSGAWKTYRYPFSIAGSQSSRFKFAGLGVGVVRIGRVRAYHSRSPVPLGLVTLDALVLAATPRAKTGPVNSVYVDAANKYVLKMSPDGLAEQASAGQLSDRYNAAVPAGTAQVLWSLGMASGYANAIFTLEIVGNRANDGQQTKRRLIFSAAGTASTPGNVASVGAVTNTLEYQSNVVWDFSIAVAVVAGKLQVSVTPTTYAGNFQAIGRWQASFVGGGGVVVSE